MISKVLLSFIIAFLFLTGSSYAQKDNYITTVKYHNGIVLPHHESITYVREDKLNAFELNFGIIPSLKQKWANLYSQPEIGLALYHGNLGNDEIWGKVSSIFPYINFHLLKKGQFHITNQLGIGLAYNNKVFHPTENYKNILISSKINAFVSFSLDAEFSINSQWQLVAGLGLKHISNGASKRPNTGINLLMSNIGIKYALNDRPHILYGKKQGYSKLENEYTIVWNHGRKQAKEKDRHKYYISNISANYAIGINAKQRLGFGLDFFYDEATNRGEWDYNPKISFKDRFSQGIHISHDLIIGNFTLTTQFGAYTFYETEPLIPIYTRVGLRYNLGNRFFTNLNLKAHGGKADNLEWGLGYRFKKKR